MALVSAGLLFFLSLPLGHLKNRGTVNYVILEIGFEGAKLSKRVLRLTRKPTGPLCFAGTRAPRKRVSLV